MKNFKVYFVLIMAFSMFSISCSSKNIEKPSGGGCVYNKFEGYAVIKSISNAPADEYNCPNQPKKILFEFTPLNLSDRQQYKIKNFSDTSRSLQINDGANPSLDWIKKNKIEVGKKYKCFRTELVSGTCTPVIFTFSDLNLFPESGCK
jgi:hypothetical protein